MPKVTAATLAVTALIVLGLTGCTGTPESSGDERTAPTVADSPAPSPTRDPLVAETPEEVNADEQFVAEARDRLAGLGAATSIPNATDDQLVDAGREACEQLVAGMPFNDVSVIEGEQRVQGSYLDSAAIATAGLLFFCPEMNGKTS